MARLEPITGRYTYVKIDGVEYRVYFEENGEGIPLVCQHTAGSDGRQWRHLLNDKEVTSSYRVIAPDLPYHGRSLPPESVEWWKQEYRLYRNFFVNFHVEFNRALGLDKPVYIGFSMGGHLAVDLAIEKPDEYRAIIGGEATLRSPQAEESSWFNHARIDNTFRYATMLGMMAPSSPEKYKRETAFEYSQSAPQVFQGDLYFYFVDHNVSETAKQIDTSRIPLYLISGEYDPAGSPEDTRALANEIRGAKFTEMKGLGHFGMSENYPMLRKYLLPILNEIADGKK
jgi:pimeloyl-ACP methyl ester carboxylesterase